MMENIILSIQHLKKEPTGSNNHNRFSHRAFTRKMPKGFVICDYDEADRLMELEFTDGQRIWCSIKEVFGVVIAEAKNILLLHDNGVSEHLSITGIEVEKVKRTYYCRLIFECILPF